MNEPVPSAPFVRKAYVDVKNVLGARWWNTSAFGKPGFAVGIAGRPMTRRAAVGGLIALAGMVGVGGALVAAFVRALKRVDDPVDPGAWTPIPEGAPTPEGATTRDLLQVQREQGWAVGADKPTLAFADAATTDVAGRPVDAEETAGLAESLAPSSPALKPFYVPTLFQVLDGPGGASLRSVVRPIASAAMDRAFATGRALRDLFQVEDPSRPAGGDVALLVDLEGPESVALAAGLLPAFQPVFVFGNWPHPAGVVPSHLTLGAALRYRPDFARVVTEAPPVFVLDRARLRPYGSDPRAFDNRYVAELPSAASLKGLGVARVLMVTPDGTTLTESDDLNDDVVGWGEAGLATALVPLTDFAPADAAAVEVEAPLATREPIPTDPATETRPREGERRYYGGSPSSHFWFWHAYPWRSAPVIATATPPLRTSAASAYAPRPRTTLFSTGLPGGPVAGVRPKPARFGQVAFRPPSTRSGSVTRAPSGFGG